MATDTHHHDEPGFVRKYVFSTDHKVIGCQYGLTSLVFLFFGFCLVMIMRWQLAYPGQPLPLIGNWLGEARMPGGSLDEVADAVHPKAHAVERHERHDAHCLVPDHEA